MAKSLKRVEIFAVGNWRGNRPISVGPDDLDHMVNSFNELSLPTTGYKPVLKLGHQDHQRYFGQTTGAPALGIVERVWREGNKVLADFANVPDALLALVEARRYNQVSVEFRPEVQHDGKTFKNVLTAVALLGAELPAVKGLKELYQSLMADTPETVMFSEGAEEFVQETEVTTFNQEQVDALIAAAVTKATDSLKAEHASKLAEAEAKVTAAEKEAADAKEATKTAQKALFDFEQDINDKRIVELVDGAIKAGKILPKAKDEMVALGKSMTGKVKLGDKEVSGADAFEKLVANMGKSVDLSEKGKTVAEQAADAATEVDNRSRAKMSADPKLGYEAARKIVLSEDEDLKNRYARMGE